MQCTLRDIFVFGEMLAQDALSNKELCEAYKQIFKENITPERVAMMRKLVKEVTENEEA